MNKKIRKITLLILMVFTFSIVLGACKPAEPVEPTLDANVIFTQAAETVAAQLTGTALSQPTATNTTQPTATPTATKPVPTATQSDAVINPTSASPGTVDTTPNPNKMVFVSDVTIPDGQIIPAGSKFVKTWRIRNTGTTTWSSNFKVRLWAGDRFGAPASFLLGQEVAPNKEVDISIEFTAPLQNGEYLSHWILSDEIEANFGNTFYVKFIVGVPASPTTTETVPTNTPEPEPTS